jgi:hypothetical protein
MNIRVLTWCPLLLSLSHLYPERAPGLFYTLVVFGANRRAGEKHQGGYAPDAPTQ